MYQSAVRLLSDCFNCSLSLACPLQCSASSAFLRPCTHWQFYPTRVPFANGSRQVARVHTASGSSGTLRPHQDVFAVVAVDANVSRRLGSAVWMLEWTRRVGSDAPSAHVCWVQACAQMRPGAFKCKCKCKRRIKCKCKCKCSASESNANANANAQQLNQMQMQMQMHLNQMQMHLNQMRINLYQMQTVFYKCVFCVQQVLIC